MLGPDETQEASNSNVAQTQITGERAFLVIHWVHEERSRVMELSDGIEITFGRAPEASVRIDHEKVSRAHARVLRRGATIIVEDAASRNGTTVNGRRIEGPTRVVSGDEIGVGPATIVVGLSTELQRRTAIRSAAHLEDRLGVEVDRARRYRRSVGVIMMRLRGAPDAVDAAIEHIGVQLRRMDELAEYGPDELAIIVPEANRAATAAAARRLAEQAIARGVLVHVGIAAFPEDGGHAPELLTRVRTALRAARRGRGATELAPELEQPPIADGEPLVLDPQMVKLYALLARIAASPITVLVLGETGVGKELIAEAVHRGSGRSAGPLVKINCATLPENLLESELFGHERGAFTGADRRKQGYFEVAAGGTLFLDEVGEMPLALQAKLLRVLERRTITRVGGTEEIAVDVRLVAATNRDLEREAERGAFRLDLYFRLCGFAVVIPPLRDRAVEILPLATRFAYGFARELGQPTPSISKAASQALLAYQWPGNVRELKNVIERAVVLQTDGVLDLDHLPERARDGAPVSDEARGVRAQVADVERAALAAALAACNGNQTHAAHKLGLTRRALIYKLEKYGLKPRPSGR
jgi:two-component system, NtrC family, response regulator AtoC